MGFTDFDDPTDSDLKNVLDETNDAAAMPDPITLRPAMMPIVTKVKILRRLFKLSFRTTFLLGISLARQLAIIRRFGANRKLVRAEKAQSNSIN